MEDLAFPKPAYPGYLQTEPGSVKVVQESFLREPGHGGDEAADPRALGFTYQHVSDMPGAPILPEGPKEATYQPSRAEREVTEQSRHSLGSLEHQPLGDLRLEGPLPKRDQGKERLRGEEVDEDRDIDESSPQDSPPSQVSPGLQSSPSQGGSSPQTVSREATGTPGFPAEGAIPLPVDLPKVSTEPDGPSAGPAAEGHDGPPEFTFHVEIRASAQKEQGRSEVDWEGTALLGGPGEEQAPLGPSEGEDTRKTDLPEPSGKQPAAGLPGKPVSRVPQLKGLCPELLHAFLAPPWATQAAGPATELPAPSSLPLLPKFLGTATGLTAWALLLTPLRPPPAPQALGRTCSPHALPATLHVTNTPTQCFLPCSSLQPLDLSTMVRRPTGGWRVTLQKG